MRLDRGTRLALDLTAPEIHVRAAEETRMTAGESITTHDCPLGQTSCADQSEFCPFIVRRYAGGELVCLIDDPAEYVWFVREGIIALDRSREPGDEIQADALRKPGSFVGLESLVVDRYLRSARTVSHATLCGATREGFNRWMRQSDQRLATVMHTVFEELLGSSPMARS
jgi:CRP-like cAMP-binding protein